jgi:hypothetical protein
VVQTYRPSRWFGGGSLEQTQVVVVLRARGSEEQGVEPLLLDRQGETEDIGVKGSGPFQVGDEEHGVIE